MPTIRDLERQVRRRPLGRTIFDICLDLAVVPGFCTGEFWNELFEIMHVLRRQRRHTDAAEIPPRAGVRQTAGPQPNSNWDWLRLKRDAVRQVLGFFIGEPPVNPLEPEAALATGPP